EAGELGAYLEREWNWRGLLYWMLVTAFKTQAVMLSMPPKFWPQPVTLRNFELLLQTSPLLRWIANGFVYAVVPTGTNILSCTLIGYLLAKREFPGRQLYFWANIATTTVPLAVYVVPLYVLTNNLKMLDSYPGLILPWLFSPTGIFMMKQFLETLPTELIDAGRIDGAGEWAVFSRIVLPLSKPGMGVFGIWSFMGFWNDFFWPLIITRSKEMRILPVGLATLRTQSLVDFGVMMAGATVAALPMVVIFFAFQPFFIQGITIGSIKG
ncbi:MAG: carbohydrate ABC transporter permease, partial [Anaerolineae bacterium]